MPIPSEIHIVIYNILEGIYLAFALVLGATLLLHIFKVRYLDYYIIEREIPKQDENVEEEKSSEEIKYQEPKKLILEKKQEKIIIRDPKHSGYKFISGLLKIVLFILKSFAIIEKWFLIERNRLLRKR